MSKIINGYELANEEKLNRVIYGSMGREGQLRGGIGDLGPTPHRVNQEEHEAAYEKKLLAYYDRLGGLVRKNGHNIKIGAFWDFVKRKPHDKPHVQFVFRDIEGKEVLIEEGEAIPLEVKAAEVAKTQKKVKKPRKSDD